MPVAQLQWDDVVRCMNVNVGGVLTGIQAVLPHFMAKKSGAIVVISSVVGIHALPYSGGYAASKGALERLCEALRIELRDSGVKLTVVRPGTVQSEFLQQRMEQIMKFGAPAHQASPPALSPVASSLPSPAIPASCIPVGKTDCCSGAVHSCLTLPIRVLAA
jgi:short-subunit dehydrogenase